MNKKLKSCPWCDGQCIDVLDFVKKFDNGERIKLYYVECMECSHQSGFYRTEETAIKCWNKQYHKDDE